MGGQLIDRRRCWRLAALLLVVLSPACRRVEPARQYPLTGQVLAVDPTTRQITIKHEDIPGLMPGMTMTFPVSAASLLDGRVPGELITATLEVSEASGRITAVTHVGHAPLPDRTNEVAMAAGVLEPGDPLPDVALIDQGDRRRSLSEWTGTPTLLTFIYTRCPLPTFCPLMDQNFATIQRAAAEDPVLRGRIRLVSISFDPDHDTPAVLAAHAKRLGADHAVWTFLTGDRVTVDRLAAKLGVGVIRPVSETEIVHNLRTIFVGADGRIVRVYSGSDWTPSQALTDLRAALRTP